LIVAGISTVLPAASTIVRVVASSVTVSVAVNISVRVLITVLVSVTVSVTVEELVMVFTCVVVFVVVFVRVVVWASLHPARDKSSEAEITKVNRITIILFTFKIFQASFYC
jgi:membrane glycosyltransferase